MCEHLAFKGAPNSNYNVKFHAFKEAPTAIVMFKYLSFIGAPSSNFNVQVQYLVFRVTSSCNVLSKATQTAIVMCK